MKYILTKQGWLSDKGNLLDELYIEYPIGWSMLFKASTALELYPEGYTVHLNDAFQYHNEEGPAIYIPNECRSLMHITIKKEIWLWEGKEIFCVY